MLINSDTFRDQAYNGNSEIVGCRVSGAIDVRNGRAYLKVAKKKKKITEAYKFPCINVSPVLSPGVSIC